MSVLPTGGQCFTTCVSDAKKGQIRAVDPLELELQMVVNCHVASRTGTWVLCKSRKCSLTAEPSL